jgi:subtilisin family serine protease
MKIVYRSSSIVYRFLLLIICCLSMTCTFAQAFQKQEIIVMLETDESWEDFEKSLQTTTFFNENLKNTLAENILINNNWLVATKQLSESMNIGLLTIQADLAELEIAEVINSLSNVKAVSLNYFAAYRGVPNDNLYQQQWNMDIINATTAWDFSTGGLTANGDTIVVFVIDEGIDLQHEDLAQNIFTNHAEIPNNGIDDDNNNYVDDYRGWYLTDDSDNHVPASHGVGVSGIIGASGNNEVGVTGVNWKVKILPFSILEAQLTAANILMAYDYALEMRKQYEVSDGVEGAYIVATNLSAGFGGRFPNSFPFFCEMYDILGNEGILSVAATANNENTNVETAGDVPTLCDSDFLITVTDTDSMDIRKGAYGQNTVDLAAPGEGCFTTAPIDRYRYFRGTSCAAPHVTGTVALLYSLESELLGKAIKDDKVETALQIKSLILDNTDKLENLKFATVTSGRLNTGKAMKALFSYYQGFTADFKLINYYPNPVDNILTVVFETPNINNFEIIIYNSVGQLLQSNLYKVEELAFKEIQIDFTHYEAGLYFLVLKNEEKLELAKIVVY